MQMPFEPFYDYGSAENIEKKLDEIFALPALPEIRINGNDLHPFQHHGGAGYYVSTLTQHIAFMLAHPLSKTKGGNIWSEDIAWFYCFEYLSVPILLSGVKVWPCYIHQCLPKGFETVFTDKSQQAEAEPEITLSPKYLRLSRGGIEVERSGEPSAKVHTLAFAYKLCLPGSQALAITQHTAVKETIPRFDMTIMYRSPKRLREHLAARTNSQ